MSHRLRGPRPLIVLGAVCVLSGNAHAELDPFAKSIQLDPGFAYYKDRSVESIASEVRVNDYRCVRLVVTRDTAADSKLVAAFHNAGLAAWYTTFANGVYSTGDLPAGWESWKMRLKENEEVAPGFTYLCLNNPQYRSWKKKQVVATLKRVPFDGFELQEPFFPAYPGPTHPLYGCLCDTCKTAFLSMYPSEPNIPNFREEKHSNFYERNRELYRKWVEFRVKSVTSFQNEIINGPGGVRESCPDVKVATWGIADLPPGTVAGTREWSGIDGALIVSAVRPDLHVIQTDWHDWSKPKLPAEYPLKHKPFVEAIRATGSTVPILLQADIGSWKNCRRETEWMQNCEAAAREAGMIGITAYEYHLSMDIYKSPPRLVSASAAGRTITLTFSKRLDASKAADLHNYTVEPGSAAAVEVDGNVVKLEVGGCPAKVTVRNLSDDPARRFFKDHPAVAMAGEATACVAWD